MERRSFNSILTGLGLSLGGGRIRAAAAATPVRIESFILRANDWVPNNPKLPVIVYRNALPISGDDPAAIFESLFQRNGATGSIPFIIIIPWGMRSWAFMAGMHG